MSLPLSSLASVAGRLLALASAGLLQTLPRPRPFPRARPGTETGFSGSDLSVSVELMTGDHGQVTNNFGHWFGPN